MPMGLTEAKIQLRNPRLPELESVEIDALANTGEAPAPESAEAERLARLARAGPAALASHELLALPGLRIDAPALSRSSNI